LIRSFSHSEHPLERLLEAKAEPVTVVLPAREVADTIGQIVERLRSLDPLIDQIVVVDSRSGDRTAEIASSLGAEVHQEDELLPELGPARGKGDALWRALSVATGELIVYLDSDTRDFAPHFATGLLAPLIHDDDVDFVKGAFERPFTTEGGERVPDGGGRVTELMARPVLSAFYPDLAAFRQPLAGEVAGRRGLFERIPYTAGYGAEIAMLLDVRDAVGVERMAQVDLGERINFHQPLHQLGPMAHVQLIAVLERLRRDGRLLEEPARALRAPDGRLVEVELVERPPYASIRARA
jgi:glucosyl-3-phosphoglycerate synthase